MDEAQANIPGGRSAPAHSAPTAAERRETQPERRAVSLNEVVSKTMELQRFGLEAEKIPASRSSWIRATGGARRFRQLQQVLMNLVGNSRQAIEQLGRAERFMCARRRSGNRRCCWKFGTTGRAFRRRSWRGSSIRFHHETRGRRNGAGVGDCAERGSRAWRPGALLESATRRRGIPDRIACGGRAQSRGDRRILQREGRSMPRASREGPNAKNGLPCARPAEKGSRVLVVEDEPTSARLIADVLEDEGI